MNRRMIRIALGTALVVPVLGALSSPASAATVVMGSTLANNFDGGVTGLTGGQRSDLHDPATSPNPVVSPVNGVITGWKVKSADDGGLYTLKVLRPNGPVSLVNMTNSNFTGVASVAAHQPSRREPRSPPRRAWSSPIQRHCRSARATTSDCTWREPLTACPRRSRTACPRA